MLSWVQGTVARGSSLTLLALASGASAVPVGVTPTKLLVVDKLTMAGNGRVVFVAKDAAATKGTGEDVEQISVRLAVTYANGATAGVFVVPAGSASGWRANNASVAKYVNALAPGGPTQTKVAVIKPGRLLKLVGKGLGDEPLDVLGAGDPAGSVVTAYCVDNAGEEYCHCSAFTGCVYELIAAGTGAKLVCRAGTADGACSAVVPPTTTTTIPCTPQTPCVSGCFQDWGDETIRDDCTGLQWEKKDTLGGLHDVGKRYTWAGACTSGEGWCQPNAAAAATCMAQASGGTYGCGVCASGTCDVDPYWLGASTTVWDWVNQINAANFAGYSDWRLPSEEGRNTDSPTPRELETILLAPYPCLYSGGGEFPPPCIDTIFGPTVGPTGPGSYWSASTARIDSAWYVDFVYGDVAYPGPEGRGTPGGKNHDLGVRAVR